MHRLILPVPVLRHCLRQIRVTSQPMVLALIPTQGNGERGSAWLVRPPAGASGSGGDGPRLQVVISSDSVSRTTQWEFDGLLVIGDADRSGDLFGALRTDAGVHPFGEIFLVGPGMHQVSQPPGSVSLPGSNPMPSGEPGTRDDNRALRWSRTIGSLGGRTVWEQLTRLRFAIVGCGRSGSLAATSLVRMGVQHLILVDPDDVEIHNLGESALLTGADVGSKKAFALAGHLLSEARVCGASSPHAPSPLIRCVPWEVSDPKAVAALREADVVISCTDNDQARLITALVSILEHKVLMDVATGIHFDPTRSPGGEVRTLPRRMGADVRLIVPGSACLLCMGGVADYDGAVERLIHGPPRGEVEPTWEEERAGSLSSLNQIAVHFGLQLLQDLVAGRVQESRWSQLDFENDGRMTIHQSLASQEWAWEDCPMCQEIGRGTRAMV